MFPPASRTGLPGLLRDWSGVVGAVAVLLAAAAPAPGQRLSYTASFSGASGTYVFADRTRTFMLTHGLTLSGGRFDVSASVPLVYQNSGVVTTIGDRIVPTGGTDHAVVSRRKPGETIPTDRGKGKGPGPAGVPSSPISSVSAVVALQEGDSVAFRDAYDLAVGDPLVGAGLEVHSGAGVVKSIRLRGTAKIPLTELGDGPGSGEWDFGAGASLLAGGTSTFFFADAAWWWYGDLPDLELQDGLLYGIGVSRAFARARGSVSLVLSGATRLIDSLDPPLTLGGGLGWQLGSRWFFSGGVNAGLTEASPDFGFYAGLTVSTGAGPEGNE